MQNILIVVDMQNDFINGTLGTKEAEAIVAKVEQKISGFSGRIIYTEIHMKKTTLIRRKERNFL